MCRIILVLLTLFALTSCNGSSDTEPAIIDETAPIVTAVLPADGATNVTLSTVISVTYDENIFSSTTSNITVNGTKITPKISGKVLTLDYILESNTKYKINIAGSSLRDEVGNFVSAYSFSFTTVLGNSAFDASAFSITPLLCTPNPSSQAVNVYDFLKENFGSKVISGTMANVNNNLDEAKWVYNQTGKWPALTCIDYIHLMNSPANWINYSDITDLKDWWNNNGLVAAMWHWNVPKSQGDSEYTFSSLETTFKTSNAVIEGSWENTVVKADLEKIAEYLGLFQKEGIPVIWRPLHEGAGNLYAYSGGSAWFWWGADGASAYKNLWVYMFDYFQSKGLDNLIWVWTTETGDSDFYPGDNYVDVVGCDVYPSINIHDSQLTYFNNAIKVCNKKIVALSECGGIPNPDQMYAKGDMWSWFMPWYGTYTESDEVNGTTYWKEVMANSIVVTRDQMPNLK